MQQVRAVSHVVPRTIVVVKRTGGLTSLSAVAEPAGAGLCDTFQA